VPLTPFHLGPASWIGIALFRVFNIPALIVSSVIVDLEPITVILFGLDYPLHGFFHSFLGGSIAAVLTALIIYLLRKPLNRVMAVFKLEQNQGFGIILWTSLFGVSLHILLDAPLYSDIKPFYPHLYNPLYGVVSEYTVYLFCGISFLVGFLLYIVKLTLIWRRGSEGES